MRSSLAMAIWLLATMASPAVGASENSACEHRTVDRPKIGLVLGGGGARGSAHIGVIRVLEEMNVPVDFVGGTSIGSLVGAFVAAGMTADELEQMMLGLDWDDLFVDDTAREDQPFRRKRDDNLVLFGPKLGIGRDSRLISTGAIAGQKISFLFERMIRERVQGSDFDLLPIPYRAVAADVITGQQVVFSEGDLAVAMRSSMSVPGVFDPVRMGKHLLVDGGIVNNVPVDVVRDMGADIIIAVDVGTGLTPEDELTSALAIVGQLTNLMIKFNTDDHLALLTERDVLITPELGRDVSSADFDKAATGIGIGYQAADAARAALAPLSLSDAEYAAYRDAVVACVTPMRPVDFVRLENRSRFGDPVIRQRLTIREGEPLDTEELDSNIRQIHALGFIELARYEVVEEGGRTGIVVHVDQDTRGTQFLEWGLDYAGDGDSSSLNFRVGYLNTAVDAFGSEFRVVTQLGEDPFVFADLYKYVNPRLKLFVEPQLFVERREFTAYEDGDPLLVAQVTQYGGALGIGRELGRSAAISLGVRSFAGQVESDVGTLPGGDFDFNGGEYFVRVMYDRLDNRYFPGRGGLIDMRYLNADENLGSDDEYEQVLVDALFARTFDRHTIMGGGRYYETLDQDAPVYALFRAGGFPRLSGYHEEELAGQNFAMGLVGYRYHFAGSGLLPAHLGMTLEYGQLADDADELFDDASFAGSFYLGYRSPIGPLYMGVGLAEGGRQRYFLRIGNVFGNSSIGR